MYYGYGYHGASFEQAYRCYPSSLINKPHLECGDKIIMPHSALDMLAYLHIDYPMLFEIKNDAAERVSHCGVLEFTADEGMVYVPSWMMQDMLLKEGDIVKLKNVTLQKGKYVKLQPHKTDFLDITNPKAVLERTLRSYSCLTTGNSIMVPYNNKQYYINILETKPSNAVSIIETDCEVDFAPPLDYKEPERPSAPLSSIKTPEKEAAAEIESKFSPFSGSGKRLDGKPLSYQPPPLSSSDSKDKSPSVPNDNAQSSASSSQSNSHKSQGKLVFGSNADRSKETAKEKESKQEAPQEKDEPKFQPFSGQKYSLRG